MLYGQVTLFRSYVSEDAVSEPQTGPLSVMGPIWVRVRVRVRVKVRVRVRVRVRILRLNPCLSSP